jgi:hypothetical protein
MIAQAKQLCHRPSPAAWHAAFLTMLPTIRTHAKIAFRHLDPESREEAVQDVVCNACCAVARLAELDKLDLAYPTVLARYAVAQVKDGRKVGCKLNVRDVLSPYCQQRKKISVERLDKFDREEGWQEIVVEDRNAGPADVAATRIDFGEWLRTLRRRDRRIAETLSVGETTGDVARRFRVSPSRVSQLRRELRDSWDEFCGDVASE